MLKKEGRWVTLEGGTHVYLDGGKVTAGPSALTGKPINRLSDKKTDKTDSKPTNTLAPAPKPPANKPDSPLSKPAEKPVENKPVSGLPGSQTVESGKPKKSNAQVSMVDTKPERAEQAKEIIRRIVGDKGVKEMASLVGAPDDSRVRVSLHSDDSVSVSIVHKDYTAERFIGFNKKGEKYIKNEMFSVKDDAQGKGIGSKVFSDQVANAADAGFSYIECEADGDFDSESMNGYYTWPRLGYDQSLKEVYKSNPGVVNFIKSKFGNDVNTVSDVMMTKEGRDWWKKEGRTLPQAKFDLAAGSRSRKILDAYNKERAERKAA